MASRLIGDSGRYSGPSGVSQPLEMPFSATQAISFAKRLSASTSMNYLTGTGSSSGAALAMPDRDTAPAVSAKENAVVSKPIFFNKVLSSFR